MKILNFIAASAYVLLSTVAWSGQAGNGENSLNGHPLEYYIKDPKAYFVYDKFIEPVLAQVEKKIPRFADDLRNVADHKVWYSVPTSLHALPPHVIGTAFHTDQDALQNQISVWINELIFNTMPTDLDRAIVLMHEMVMGVRLSQLDTATYCNDQDPAYCGRVLAPADYDNIRDLTNILLKKLANTDAKTLTDFLFTKGFGDYRNESTAQKLQYLPSLDMLERIFEVNERDSALPTQDTLSNNGCAFEHTFDPATQTFTLTVQNLTDPHGLNMAEGQTLTAVGVPNVSIIGGYLTRVTLSEDKLAIVNSYRKAIAIDLATDGVVGVQLTWQRYDLDIATGLNAWKTVTADPQLYYGQSKSCVRPGKKQ